MHKQLARAAVIGTGMAVLLLAALAAAASSTGLAAASTAGHPTGADARMGTSGAGLILLGTGVALARSAQRRLR